jgi:hypothetical protein
MVAKAFENWTQNVSRTAPRLFPDRGFPDRGFPDRGFPDHS